MRHGQSQANAAGLLAGQYDSPLTEYGMQQAVREARLLRDEGRTFDIIISSPLVRAYDTATAVAQGTGYPVSEIVIDDRLMERDSGELVGRPAGLLQAAIKVGAHGVETNHELATRCQSFLDDVQATYADKRVLLVSHAGTGEMLQLLLQKRDSRTFVTDGLSIPNAQVFQLR